MTPVLASRLRKLIWPLLLLLGVVAIIVPLYILNSRIENVPDEWLYVTTNSVLLFPVVSDKCRIKYALMQVHKGTKVLVIARQGEWVEVEQNDQTALHTHGCIHESMLEKRDD